MLAPGTVVDADPRTISNLIADQTLNNPAAISAALTYAGITGAAQMTAISQIQAARVAIAKAGQTADRHVAVWQVSARSLTAKRLEARRPPRPATSSPKVDVAADAARRRSRRQPGRQVAAQLESAKDSMPATLSLTTAFSPRRAGGIRRGGQCRRTSAQETLNARQSAVDARVDAGRNAATAAQTAADACGADASQPRWTLPTQALAMAQTRPVRIAAVTTAETALTTS